MEPSAEAMAFAEQVSPDWEYSNDLDGDLARLLDSFATQVRGTLITNGELAQKICKRLREACLLYDHAYGATLSANISRVKSSIYDDVERIILEILEANR